MLKLTATIYGPQYQISIRGLEVYAYHGVYESEQQEGQRFLIDVDLTVDLSEAARSDRLEDTLDYEALVQRIGDLVKTERFNLLEKLVDHVAEQLLAERYVDSVVVSVTKPDLKLTYGAPEIAMTVTKAK